MYTDQNVHLTETSFSTCKVKPAAWFPGMYFMIFALDKITNILLILDSGGETVQDS